MNTPKNLITFKEVKTGIDSYYKSIPETRKSTQTQSIWFAFIEIKNFLAYIEKKANDQEIPISGLRFHFITDEKETDKISIAICPTVEMTNESGRLINPSFDPEYSQKGTPVLLETLLNDPKISEEVSCVINKGDRCPVMCPTNN